MSIYRYVGAFTEIGSIAEGDSALNKFGQSIQLSDALARDVILGGGAILPAATFDKLGFLEQELSLYSDVYTHSTAPEAFLLKKRKALLAYHDLRLALEAGEPLTPKPDAPVSHSPGEPQNELSAAPPTRSRAIPTSAAPEGAERQ